MTRLLWERSRILRFRKTESWIELVNLLWERLSVLMDENENEVFSAVGLRMLPPNLFLERFISNKDELDQNQHGT